MSVFVSVCLPPPPHTYTRRSSHFQDLEAITLAKLEREKESLKRSLRDASTTIDDVVKQRDQYRKQLAEEQAITVKVWCTSKALLVLPCDNAMGSKPGLLLAVLLLCVVVLVVVVIFSAIRTHTHTHTHTHTPMRIRIRCKLQLSKETETIGEYIALYQQQKQSMLNTLASKDSFIEQLKEANTHLQRQLELHNIVDTQPAPTVQARNSNTSSTNSAAAAHTAAASSNAGSGAAGAGSRSGGDFDTHKRNAHTSSTPPPSLEQQQQPPQQQQSRHSAAQDTTDPHIAHSHANRARVPEWVQAATSHGYYAKFSVLSL